MSDYERTVERQTTAVDPTTRSAPVVRTYSDPVVPADPAVSSVRTTEREVTAAGPSAAEMLSRLVIFIFGVIQVLLILRVILLILVANPGNDVVALILNLTDPLVEPFRGMFQLDRVRGDQGSVLDVAAIVALIGWTLVEALILALLRVFDRSRTVTV